MDSQSFKKKAVLRHKESKKEMSEAILRQKSAEGHEASGNKEAAQRSRMREKQHKMVAEGKMKQAKTFLATAKNLDKVEKITSILSGQNPRNPHAKIRRELKQTNGTIAEKEVYGSKQRKACATPCKQNRATCNPMSWCDTRYYCNLAKSDGSKSGEILQCITPKKKKGGTVKRKRKRSRKRTRKKTRRNRRKKYRSKTQRRRHGGSKRRRRVKTRRKMKRGGG